MGDITDVETDRERTLKTLGHVSYLLHLVVAIGAVLPGVQASIVLLLVAFMLDLVKKDDAANTWQETHFRWRIRSVLWAGGLYLLTLPLWLLIVLRFLPKVPMANRLVLQAELGGTAPSPATAPDLTGRHGHATTPLRPGGKISVDGQILDVVAEGEFVAQGEPVEVLRVEGLRIVVARTKR